MKPIKPSINRKKGSAFAAPSPSTTVQMHLHTNCAENLGVAQSSPVLNPGNHLPELLPVLPQVANSADEAFPQKHSLLSGMPEFVAWALIAFVDPEKETLLLVAQKPKLDEHGALQFHGDGQIKATWPAFIPTERLLKKPPAPSMYINSGVFPKEFPGGRVSAARVYIEVVWCIPLDDVGKDYPSGAHLLKPTWIFETSTGNFQHGYAFLFKHQPNKADYCAMYNAMARCGWTDPGAGNPVRNIRLPGSINIKPGRGEFQTRVVEWNKDCIYTPEQILEAYGVTIIEADRRGGGAHAPIQIEDDGNDIVLKWLSENNQVLSQANSSGWLDVLCPNAAEHSDGSETARYHPVHRSFKCMHGHCDDIGSREYLAYVVEQGGPAAAQGLRPELMQAALAALPPQPEHMMFDTDAAAIAQRMNDLATNMQNNRDKADGMFLRYAYITDDDSYFDMILNTRETRSVLDALYRGTNTKSIHLGARGNPVKTSASKYFDERREFMGAQTIRNLTYSPGQPVLLKYMSETHGNLWRDAREKGRPGPITPWVLHFERLIPDPFERMRLFLWMAFKVQYPSCKINYQISWGGRPGSGKDLALEPFLFALGGPLTTRRNVRTTDLDKLMSRFNYDLECELLIINEARESPSIKDRRATENKLKPFCAAPPTLLQIEKKGQTPYFAVNCLSIIMMSNHQDPIAIPTEDRRWFVIWSKAPIMTEEERLALIAFYDGGGLEHVAHYLRTLDVTSFDPYAPPPMTEAKAAMIEYGRSDLESFIVERITAKLPPFDKEIVASPLTDVCGRLQMDAPAGSRVTVQALRHALEEAGWIYQGRLGAKRPSGPQAVQKHVWIAPDAPFAGDSKTALRLRVDALSQPVPPALAKILDTGKGKSGAH